MACNDWISCLSDSDDSLPSCSQYLHSQKKSHDSDIGGYKSLTQRLEKTNERIDVVGSSGTLQSITSAKHTNIVVQKETKKARKRKNEVKTTDNEKENDEKIEIYKPEELYPKLICTISLSVVALLTSKDVMSTIQENLPNKCVFVDEAEPVVNWRLNLPANDREEFSGLDQRLFVLKAEQLVNLVPGKPLNSSGRTLSEWFLSLGNATTSTHIVCYGLKKFKQLLKRNENRKYKNAVLGNDAKHQLKKNNDQVTISADDIPDIFVHIQLTYGVDVIVVENELEFVGLLSHITKAIAEAPLKRCQRKDVQFVQGNSVKIDASTGEGSRTAWELMLEQLFSVSSDISSTICLHYPSLTSLMQAYQRSSSAEAANLLSDIVVRRGVGTLQQSRRIGPELSKRVHRLFTTKDKDEVI